MAVINEHLSLSDIIQKKRFDSEYFQPDYVTNETHIRNTLNGYRKLGNIAYITDGDHSVRKYTNSGIPFLTSENISEFNINYETERYISPVYEKTLARSRSEKNAIYITKTGRYYGKAAICSTDYPIFNIPADVGKIKIKNENISPFFVVAYLNSKYGNTAIRRENSGGTRDRITLVNLKNVEIPLINNTKIETMIDAYINSLERSKSLYNSAKELLTKELNLESINRKEKIYSETKFSKVLSSHRLDPQHYEAKYADLINHLADFNCKKIKDIRSCNRRGVQPIYVEGGSIDVVNSQHIGKMHLQYDSLEKTSERIFSKSTEGHIKENDLLIYTTGAYIGQTNVYLKNTPALASNHVNILRIKSDIDPVYMGLIFQTEIGKYQTEMHLRGSAQAELYPSDIDKFIVPILDPKIQEQIGDLIRNSFEVENESKLLLQEVKKLAEELVTGGTENESIL